MLLTASRWESLGGITCRYENLQMLPPVSSPKDNSTGVYAGTIVFQAF